MKSNEYRFQYPSQNLQTILTVIELLSQENVHNISQFIQLKKAIIKWDEENNSRLNDKNQRIMKLQQEYKWSISQQMGIVVEQMQVLLRSMVQNYTDNNLYIYYKKYMSIIQKMKWDHTIPISSQSISIQTEQQLKEEQNIYRNSQGLNSGSSYAELQKEYIQIANRCNQLTSLLQEFKEDNSIIQNSNLALEQQVSTLMRNNQIIQNKIQQQNAIINELKNKLNNISNNPENFYKTDLMGCVEKSLNTAESIINAEIALNDSHNIIKDQPLLRMIYAQALGLESKLK